MSVAWAVLVVGAAALAAAGLVWSRARHARPAPEATLIGGKP